MVRPSFKSGKFKKIKRTKPSGRSVVHHRKAGVGPAICARCRNPLSGVLKLRQTGYGKVSKTKHRPNRPFGGILCSSCSRAEIKERLLK